MAKAVHARRASGAPQRAACANQPVVWPHIVPEARRAREGWLTASQSAAGVRSSRSDQGAPAASHMRGARDDTVQYLTVRAATTEQGEPNRPTEPHSGPVSLQESFWAQMTSTSDTTARDAAMT